MSRARWRKTKKARRVRRALNWCRLSGCQTLYVELCSVWSRATGTRPMSGLTTDDRCKRFGLAEGLAGPAHLRRRQSKRLATACCRRSGSAPDSWPLTATLQSPCVYSGRAYPRPRLFTSSLEIAQRSSCNSLRPTVAGDPGISANRTVSAHRTAKHRQASPTAPAATHPNRRRHLLVRRRMPLPVHQPAHMRTVFSA